MFNIQRHIRIITLFVLAGANVMHADGQTRHDGGIVIDTLYGARSLELGELENYRVRVEPGAVWPIQYFWEMGDGTESIGNNIVHRYSRPGTYRVKVRARNRVNTTVGELYVTVGGGEAEPVTVRPPVIAASEQRETVMPSGTEVKTRPTPKTKLTAEERLEDDEDDQSFAWVMETTLDQSSAERALRRYRNDGIPGVRILIDPSGKGSPAYRIVIGNYLTLDSAARAKEAIEELVGKSVWLFAFSER